MTKKKAAPAPKPPQADHRLSLEERATAQAVKDGMISPEEAGIDSDLADVEVEEEAAPPNMEKLFQLPTLRSMLGGSPAGQESTRLSIPEIKDLFPDRDVEFIETHLKHEIDGQLDTGEEPDGKKKKITVRAPFEPPDIYTNKLDPKLVNWFMFYCLTEYSRDAKNDEQVKKASESQAKEQLIQQYAQRKTAYLLEQVLRIARARNTPPVALIRQCMVRWMREGKWQNVDGVLENRRRQHDDENHEENEGLIQLLEWSTWDILNGQARAKNCGAAQLMVKMFDKLSQAEAL